MPLLDNMTGRVDEDALNSLITEYMLKNGLASINGNKFPRNAILDDLGVDSLQAIELADILGHQFAIEITASTLIVSTMNDILQCGKNVQNPVENEQQASSPRLQSSEGELILSMIARAAEFNADRIEGTQALGGLLDDLAMMELEQELEEAFPGKMQSWMLKADMKVAQLLKLLDINLPDSTKSRSNGEHPEASASVQIDPDSVTRFEDTKSTPLLVLAETDATFDLAAQIRGYSNYWSQVAPLFDELVLAYIVEGFNALGLDLTSIPSETLVPSIPHLPKYERLFSRLWNILEKADVVVQGRGHLIRSNTHLEKKSAAQLSNALEAQYPAYGPEVRLLNLVGSKLAQCVSGKVNPVHIMFGSLPSLEIMQNFYTNSPMMSTLTDQLVRFLSLFLKNAQKSSENQFRILEVGAGTGGTTTRLVDALQELGVPISYTFTDISPAFVAQAKRKFADYPWMEFIVFNLEHELPLEFRAQYDIVLGANVVHATSDRMAACQRLRETLRYGGFLVLSEITRVIDWYDIVFGMLDGWWMAEGGKGYPIQDAGRWMAVFRRAGFREAGHSTGEAAEAQSQQLLVACV